MRQQLYLESRFGYELANGEVLFWLQDPIILPNPQEHQFSVSVPDASFPLTHYAITGHNRDLEIMYDDSAETIHLPLGNYSIDEVLDYINIRLKHGYRATYSDNTNSIHVSTADLNSEIEIGPGTTCGTLLGVRVGDVSVLGSYYAPYGVNLAGTGHFFVRGNLRTRNRDPVTLGYSNLLAKVPITRAHNGVEKYSQPGYAFAIQDRTVNYLLISVLDEDMQPVEFHGGHWSITVEFSVIPAETYNMPRDYRMLLQNGSLGNTADPPPNKREDQDKRRPKRSNTRNTHD